MSAWATDCISSDPAVSAEARRMMDKAFAEVPTGAGTVYEPRLERGWAILGFSDRDLLDGRRASALVAMRIVRVDALIRCRDHASVDTPRGECAGVRACDAARDPSIRCDKALKP